MAGKRALVVYDTKYGATEQIANWIAEGINDADIRHVDDVEGLDYDLVVVGTPIYNDMPSPRIVDFLDKYRDVLLNRKLALFTVSVPYDMTPERAKRYAGQKELKRLFDHTKGTVIASRAFLGKVDLKEMTELDRISLRIRYFLKGFRMKEVNFTNRDDAVDWGKKLYELLTKPPETMPPQQKEY
ncbi:flavodoxin domain-containing protein [Methanocella sp. MCL-LM]|uniref:flavodoxin domain-containing protein n=1 Tax=Methanocella sp. MCL-LM TaxID=3412035 RepID=UPI003C767669